MTECPTQQFWQAVLEQRLPSAEEAALSLHAEACSSCQQQLETITRAPSLSLVRQVRDTHDSRALRQTPPLSRFGDTSFTSLGLSALPESGSMPRLPGYEILEELGSGGMGVVFKARHLELNRIVALKMLREGTMEHKELRARFRDEARAVARLQHPGIVQIHEVGTLEGRPYLALEYVPGPSLDRVLRDSPLAPRDAAALLLSLAEALQAAHQQGVLHRDLKPANVLLAVSDQPSAISQTKGTSVWLKADSSKLTAFPKITDFGLAKPIDEDSSRTQAGMIVGTPCYMAPEQAAGERKLGPAADVYALGAILYECLTGRPPFMGVTAHDTLHQVLTEEPAAPRGLQSALPIDLETICLKCLRKQPEQRYGSAADLADDLRRFLDGRPIQARPVGRLERTWRWCRRNPVVAGLSAAMVLLLLAASVTGWLLAAWAWDAEQQARRERDQKEEQRRLAVEQAELANAIKQFLQYDVLRLADPATQHQAQASGLKYDADLKLRDVVLRASKAIEGKFLTQPLVEAELRWTLGHTLHGMGRADLAVAHLERARTLLTQQRGPNHRDTLGSMSRLAVVYSALGRHAEALKLHEATLAGQQAILGPDHADTLGSMSNVALSYAALGRHAEALKLHETTLARRQATLGPDHPDTLWSMSNLANAYFAMERHAEALTLREDALARRKAVSGPDHPDTLSSMYNLARSYEALGRAADALKLYEDTLARREAALGPDHPDTLGSMNSLTPIYTSLGRHAKAQAIAADLIRRLEARLTKHPEEGELAMMLAGACCNLGILLRDHGQPAQALPWFAKGQARLEQLLVREPSAANTRLYIRNIHASRAQTYERLRRFAEADADWAKAIDHSPPPQKAMVKADQEVWKAKRTLSVDGKL